MRQLSAVPLLALAAACSTYDPVTPAPAPAPVVIAPAPAVAAPPAPSVPVVVQAPSGLRPGHGRIDSITWLGTSAAAGASSQPMRRFRIRMEDGSMQTVDSAAEGFSTGDWIELTSDGYIRRS